MSKLVFDLRQEIEGHLFRKDNGELMAHLEGNGCYELFCGDELIESYCQSGFEEYFTMPDTLTGEVLVSTLATACASFKLVISDRRPNTDGDEYLELVPEFNECDGKQHFVQYVIGREVYEDGGDSGWDYSMDERMRDAFPKAKRLFVYVKGA